MFNKLEVCAWWMKRGFSILPCQQNTKHLIAEYGEHRNKIEFIDQAAAILDRFPGCNIGVLGDERRIILDFDDADLYHRWSAAHPDLALTYTERTPNDGFHVWLYGDRPRGFKTVQGVELKNICMVSPSIVDWKPYMRGDGEILELEDLNAFSLLGVPGQPSARLILVNQHKPKQHNGGERSLVDQIKSENDILRIFELYAPESPVRRNDSRIKTLCPFHEDRDPSFVLFLDDQRYWCSACGVGGDVIDLYAMFEGISTREAIARMARGLRKMGVEHA